MPTNVSTTVAQGAPDTQALSLVGGDTLNLFSSGFIIAYGSGVSPGIQAGGSNIFNLSGSVMSMEDIGIRSAAGGNNFNVGVNATIFGRGDGIAVSGSGGNVINNAGDIGSLFGTALFVLGNSNNVSNSGNMISSNSIAILLAHGGNTVTNSGYVSGAINSVNISGANNTIINTGTLDGRVNLFGDTGVDALFNAGTMTGKSGLAYDGSNGQDRIINNGLIQGVGDAIALFGGNDIYDGRNGTVVGAVLGGDGDDLIYGGLGGENINGGNNNDQIFGGGGSDVIIGGAGIDLILGGAGGDVLQGGLGVDLFGFNAGDNGDLIQAFNESGVRDGFDLRGYFNATGYTGTTPRAAGIMAVLQNGADTDVYLHGAFAFRIQNVVAAAIDDSYFLFQ